MPASPRCRAGIRVGRAALRHRARTLWIAFGANLGIALSKLAAFAVTGAASLLAESIHSLADTGNQGLLFLGGARSKREATDTHPFGFGRERFFWAFVVALVLFSVGSLFAIYEGIQKVISPSELESPGVAFGVLGVAVVLESLSLHTAVREANKVRGPGSWWSFIHGSKNPELPSLLIGEAASPEMQRSIHDAILGGPEVDRLIHLRTEHLGPEDLLVAAKVDLSPTADQQVARAIDRVEARIRARVPQARVIYLEPDEFRGDNDPY